MFDHAYWDKVTNIISLYESLYVVLRLMDSEVVPAMTFEYRLMQVMKENLIRQETRDWIFKIIKKSLRENTKTSTSCSRYLSIIYLYKFLLLIYLIFSNKIINQLNFIVAYFLNPRFQYWRGVGSDSELLQAVYDIYAKLDSTTESFGQFENEVNKKLLFLSI